MNLKRSLVDIEVVVNDPAVDIRIDVLNHAVTRQAWDGPGLVGPGGNEPQQ